MHQNGTKRFWVVGLKTLNHELDRSVIHVGHGEARHVEDNTLHLRVSNLGCKEDEGDLQQYQPGARESYELFR